MYAGRVACCLMVNHVEYVPCALLRLEKDGTDGRTPDRYITLNARRRQRNGGQTLPGKEALDRL